MADESFVLELGERPSACKVSTALVELGSAAVKQYVTELLESGLTRSQVNVLLQDEIIPAFNVWLRENYYCIMRMIHGEAPRHTVN